MVFFRQSSFKVLLEHSASSCQKSSFDLVFRIPQTFELNTNCDSYDTFAQREVATIWLSYCSVSCLFSVEPKYADPIAGSTTTFQARLSELASLEAETVRYERMKKMKRKTKDRDD